MKSLIRFIVLCVAMFTFVACDALFGSKPTVIISSPASGSQYQAGQDVAVQSTSSDPQGIARVELIVDGGTPPAKTDASPTGSPQSQFTVIQVWNATGAGQHTITVRATDGSGTTGEAAVTITVVGQVAAVSPTPTSTIAGLPPIATAVPSSTPSSTSAPANTPVPGACSPNVQFIADVTIPDGTTVAAGSSFVKTWRVKNSGTCTWDSAYTIVYVGGEQFGAPSPSLIPQAAPGATVDLSLSMIAPSAGGSHFSSWQLRSSNGSLFGTNLTAVINVPGAPGATATKTSTPPPSGCTGSPNISSFTASPSTIIKGNSATLSWGAVTNADSVEIDQGIGGVPAPGSKSVSPTTNTTYTLTAHCGGNTRTAQVTVTVVGNFAGHWDHDFGTMDITQNGASVTGTYHNSYDGGNGTVAGTVSGNTLNGTYQKISTGPIQFILGSAGNTFTGSWDGTNQWCGARSGVSFPSGCGFDGHWNTKYDPGTGTQCAMDLSQVGTSVTGTYCNGTIQSGVITYIAGYVKLSGTWNYTGVNSGPFIFYLPIYTSLQFQGDYNTSLDWCGWRNTSSMPSPCLK